MGAPGAQDAAPAPLISLSRRFLSLPEELVGCSLPPKVSGPQWGFVTLCVAHILESAVSSRPLPQVSLIRTRWWGEEQPGSLFRPILLAGDGGAHVTEDTPRRAISMKYPVCAPPEKLLEYFQDMTELTLDVIDRVTRKQYGNCHLSLVAETDNSVLTAEEKLVALRREEVLCEIQPNGDENGVLGYLSVSFNVEWENIAIQRWRGVMDRQETEVQVLEKRDSASGTEGAGEEPLRSDNEQLAVLNMASSASLSPIKSVTKSGTDEAVVRQAIVSNKEKPHEIGTRREASVDFQRIHRLLEKGKALKQSMERAVMMKNEYSETLDNFAADEAPNSDTNVADKLATNQMEDARSVELFTSLEGKWDEHLPDLDSPGLSPLSRLNPYALSVKEQDAQTTSELPRREELLKPGTTLQEPNAELLCGHSLLQFAVMFDLVSITRNVTQFSGFTKLEQGQMRSMDKLQGGDHVESSGLSHVVLHYVVPSQFTTGCPAVGKFERTIRRQLKGSRWVDNASRAWADCSGHIHVFQPSFAADASEYFSSGCLIVETWLQVSKDADRILLGLSKLPLRRFATFLRSARPDLQEFSEQMLPFIGVDGRFAVDNPFTGIQTGFLRGRVCLGTAEQLLTWTKTFRAIVKLQGIIRGVLSRQELRCSRSIPPRVVPTTEDIRSDSPSTAPTLTTTIPGDNLIELDDKYVRGDTSEKPSESGELEFSVTVPTNEDIRLALRKIRLEIRETWRSAAQDKDLTNEQHKRRGWSAAPLLGCELQGQLVLRDSTRRAGNVKGISFALWWDAADRNLNSAFVHTFRSRAYRVEGDVDGALVTPQSQMLFALHVENGFFGTQSREIIIGEARLNLYETFEKRVAIIGATQNVAEGESCVNVDVPIEWESGGLGRQKLPSAIPLKILYHFSCSTEQPINAGTLRGEQASDHVADTEDRYVGASDAPVKRFKSATITLSFHLLSIAEFEYLLYEKKRQLFLETSTETTPSSAHLDDVLNRGGDALSIVFDVTICVGCDLDERDKVLQKEGELIQNTTTHVFVEKGKWYKTWRSPEVRIPVTSTRFEEMQLVMQSCMRLNPDTVANLQEECAAVAVLLSCSTCSEPHVLGCADVPLAAVLFRSQGVRGMFPIRIGKEPSAARLGVHCFVDHTKPDRDVDSNDNISRLTDIQLKPEVTPSPLISPTNTDKITRTGSELLSARPMKSCEVCIEEGRNLSVNAAESTVCLYAAFRMTRESQSQTVNELYGITHEKRTEAKAGMCPKWNYWDTLDVDDTINWQNFSLEVSVWQDNRNDSTRPEHTRTPPSDQRANGGFVGMVRVDLSLFNCGWGDIDGWYHIQDAQHQTRGQVKVQVRNLSVANTRNPAVSVWEHRTLHEADHAVDLDGQYFGSITGDEKTIPQFSLDNAVQTVHETSTEMEERLAELEKDTSIQEENDTTTGTNVLLAASATSGSESDTPKPLRTMPDTCIELELTEQHGGAEADEQDTARHKSSADNFTVGSAVPEMSVAESVDMNADDDSDSDGLEIRSEFFQPITLASIGIDEMEFSPLSEDEATFDTNEQEKIAECAVISPRSCEKSLGSETETDAVLDDQFDHLSVLQSDVKEEQISGKTFTLGNEEFYDIAGLWKAPDDQLESCTMHKQANLIETVSFPEIKSPEKDEAELKKLVCDVDEEDTFSTPLAASTTSDEQVIEARSNESSQEDPMDDEALSTKYSPSENRLSLDTVPSTQDPPDHSSGDVDTGLEMESPRVVGNIPVTLVLECNVKLDDLSCADDVAPSETTSIQDFDSKESVKRVLDASSRSCKCVSKLEYVDKAIQVDPLDLGLEVEMVACSVQTEDPERENDEIVSKDNDDRATIIDHAELSAEETLTIDVGCDAMDIPSDNYCTPQTQTLNVDEHSPVTMVRTYLHNTTSSGDHIGRIGRLPSSEIRVFQRLHVYNNQVEGKSQHSSVHYDSETERIARIMQGSMNYWMRDESTSSSDDQVDDDEEMEDDGFF